VGYKLDMFSLVMALVKNRNKIYDTRHKSNPNEEESYFNAFYYSFSFLNNLVNGIFERARFAVKGSLAGFRCK